MSEDRRMRQQENLQPQKTEPWQIIAVIILVVLVFGAAFYAVNRRRAPKHDAFAKCLADKKVTMYGLYWCTHCEEQKEMFGASFQYVPYVECGIKGSRQEDPTCLQAGVKNFPTWQFPDGTRSEGAQSLEFLSKKSGCSLP